MLQLNLLKTATSLSDLALLLEIQPQILSYILYKIPSSQKYVEFEIPKKTGGRRKIQSPEPRLKYVQTRLAKLLSACNEEIIASRKVRKHCTLAHGFRKNFSTYTNAELHRNRRYVFNIDISNFFGEINFGRVRGFFLKNSDFLLHSRVATTIAQIVCHNNSLPQGAPTSPVVSNLIANILDMRINKLAKQSRCTYTRYADDLTFSTNKTRFPSRIGKERIGSDHSWVAGKALKSYLKDSGFAINAKKTRMQYRDSRQDVTGLIVNKKINIKDEYYRQTRLMCHALFKKGYAYRKSSTGQVAKISIDSLRGRLSYIFGIKTRMSELKRIVRPQDRPAFYALYLKFLDFVTFYDRDAPLILCEGETDNIYLKCALPSLAKDFPSLATKASAGKSPLKVELFNYTKTSGIVQQLSGGSADLSGLIRTYIARMYDYTAPVKRQPVIIVVDDDSGGEAVFAAVKHVLGAAPAKKNPFIHVFHNLYVVPVPIVKGATSTIEDLFPTSLLSTPLDGKTFSAAKNIDPSRQFGKTVFAEKIVKPSRDKIDYSGFKPLLSAIDAAISDFASRSMKRAA